MERKPTYEELEQRLKGLEEESVKRKRAEEQLAKAASAMVDAMDNALLLCTSRGEVTFVNRAFEKMTGHVGSELVGKKVADVAAITTQPEDAKKTAAAIESALTGKAITPAYTTFVSKDGREIPVFLTVSFMRDLSGEPSSAVVTFRDMTEHRQTEETLRESEQKLKAITASAQDAIIMMNGEGGICYWNDAAQGMFGHSAQDALGQELHLLLTPQRYYEAYGKGFGHFKKTGQGAAVGRTLELTALRKDGTEFPVELSLSAVKIKGEWNAIGIIRDISERKRAEEVMQKAKEAAETADRAKSEFLANMSHEIRTPMNAIIGMTDLALDTKLTAEQREYLEIVKTSGDALLTLINDILDFSKIESGKLDLELIEFDLLDNVGDTLRALSVGAHEKRLELSYHVLPDVPETLIGDPGRLRQILVNLVGNAIKFTEQGEIVVRVEKESGTEDNACLRFSVTDTGVGIPTDKQQLILEPFIQADSSATREYGGTGLGLAISKNLVEMMGGDIQVESEVGKGTTLHFTACFDRPKMLSMRPMVAESFDARGLRVLVVDDNATNRRILQEILLNWHMKPTAVGSGKAALAALERAREQNAPFSLVLLDAVMPEMDGFAFAKEVRKRTGLIGVVIVLLTSAGQRGDAAQCRDLDISAYLIKPIKQSDLLDTIMAVMAYRQKDDREAPLITRHSLREIEVTQPLKGTKPLKILVAEDNVVNQRLVVRMLEKRGHSVVVASDGREAVAAFEKERFDLVLMDVQMPEMDGLEATRRIRNSEQKLKAQSSKQKIGFLPMSFQLSAFSLQPSARSERLPIIAVTAHAMKGDRDRCLEAGMDDYVSKPIKPRELFQAIEKQISASERAESKADTDS